jgi:signal transduction histidine kinase
MAEVATGVLHNVGNVLNSINVSAALVARTLSQSKLPGLIKGARMLREHPAADLGRFLGQDPKGQKLPEYLLRLAEHLSGEQREMEKELGTLAQHLDHVKRVIAMQQGYAKASGVTEEIVLAGVIEDSIRLQGASFERHGIQVVRQFEAVPPMDVDKHQLLQILVNLFTNAKHAMDRPDVPIKCLTIRIGYVAADRGKVFVEVRDSGIGIAADNLTRIFSHGFTTKAEGHGFGLHGSALAAVAMHGSLVAESDGPGRGACFRLCLPAPARAAEPVGEAA